MSVQKAIPPWGGTGGDGGTEADPPQPGMARDTILSLAYAGTALAVVGAWALLVGGTTTLAPFAFAALVAAVFVAEQTPLPVSPRSFYTMSTPIVLITGLAGGPVAGAVAGATTIVADLGGGWRRSATYGSLNTLQGFLAGLAGMVTVGGSDNALVCASLAAAALLCTNVVGRHIVHRVRRMDTHVFARPATIVDATETLVTIPVLAVLLQSYDTSGATLMLLTIAALLVALFVGARIRAYYAKELERHHLEARTDALTGVANRRAYEEKLDEAVALARERDICSALLVFDIDHFKEINSNHTWDGGDAVLKEIVERLPGLLRANDQIARRGGEEFCIVAVGIRDEPALAALGNRVRAFVKAVPFDVLGRQVPVTVSVGATIVDGRLGPGELDSLANEALAKAKKRRDRMVIRLPLDPKPRVYE